MKLYVWNLDAEGTTNRVAVFASDEQEAYEVASEELGIDLGQLETKPEVFEARAVAFELTGIKHLKERVARDYKDCAACGCVIQNEGGESENGILCSTCGKKLESMEDEGEEDCQEPEYDDSMDGDAQSALSSAGFGTSEDYFHFEDDLE
jgi:hypothetical protein